MGRIILLTAAGGVALVALLYGVVLNGFELFGPTGNTTALSRNGPPKEIRTRIDPGATGARAPAPKSDRADLAPPPGRPAEAATTDATEQTAAAALPPSPEPSEPAFPRAARAARDVTPPNVLSRPTSPYREPVVEEAEAAAAEEAPARRYHRVLVKDAGTLQSGGLTIRFAGIEPVSGDRTCTDEAGHDWPCGRIAAGALRMLIRNRAVVCSVVSTSPDVVSGSCSVGLQDLNGWLVAQGWAEDAGGGYAAEAEAARKAKRGVHLADWQEKPTGGGGGAVSLSAFTAPTVRSDPFSPLAQGTVEGAADQGAGLVDAVEGDE